MTDDQFQTQVLNKLESLDSILRGNGTAEHPGLVGRMSHLEQRDKVYASEKVVTAAQTVRKVEEDPAGGWGLYNWLVLLKSRHDQWAKAMRIELVGILGLAFIYAAKILAESFIGAP